MIFVIENSFMGNGQVSCIVEADDEDQARRLAIDAFKKEESSRRNARPSFWTPNEHWSVYAIELPYVCELS